MNSGSMIMMIGIRYCDFRNMNTILCICGYEFEIIKSGYKRYGRDKKEEIIRL